MSCETARDWIAEQGGGNVLTLYGTKICTFRYFTNDGSKQIGEDFSQPMRERILHFINLRTRITSCTEDGASIKNGNRVWAGFGRSYTMDQNRNLYLVEYARMTFKDSNGSTNSTYGKMEKIVRKGKRVFLFRVCRKFQITRKTRAGRSQKMHLQQSMEAGPK